MSLLETEGRAETDQESGVVISDTELAQLQADYVRDGELELTVSWNTANI